MAFIDPKTDFGFKRIFAGPNSKPILRSFLNAILYEGQPIIEELTILDPSQQPPIIDFKLSIVDLKAKLNDGTTVLIEMQVAKVDAFLKRILYNSAKAYSNQLGQGYLYSRLEPIIALTITDFNLFEGEEPISHFQILNRRTHQVCSTELQWVFVELPKFHKSLSELADLADRWLFFLQQATELAQIPNEMNNDPNLAEAFNIANESQLSIAERNVLEYQIDRIRLAQGELIAAQREGLEAGLQAGLEQGLEQGREQGREQGLEQGLEQGREEGAREQAIAIARRLLPTLPLAQVSEITGLDEATLRGIAPDDP